MDRQQRPVGPVVGQMLAPQTVFGPRKIPPAARQSLYVLMAHEPSVRQHAPEATVQFAFEHAVPGPRQMPCSVAHTACVAAMQFPEGKQHAPEGDGQFAVAQAEPFPR